MTAAYVRITMIRIMKINRSDFVDIAGGKHPIGCGNATSLEQKYELRGLGEINCACKRNHAIKQLETAMDIIEQIKAK